MNFIKLTLCVFLFCIYFNNTNAQERKRELFNSNWQFFKGGAVSPETNNYDVSDWEKVELPHDWSVEDLENTNSPFNPKAVSHVNTGFFEGGTGWYTKTFEVAEADKGKRITLTFEGVYMNSTVWLNGQIVGGNPYGYTEFTVDLTEKLLFGKKNMLMVKVNNEGENSRWYSGSGIYRHVWLNIYNPINIANWGVFVTTPVITKNNCQTNVQTKLQNQTAQNTNLQLTNIVVNAAGKIENTVNTTVNITAKNSETLNQSIEINNPILWTIKKPYQYKLITKIYQQSKLIDSVCTTFGVRSLKFGSDGFFINGLFTKLNGGCMHHDNGPLGSKAYDRAEVRKVQILKNAGFNAVRTSHNPPSTAFLNACDSLGMLVIDEAFDCWQDGKNPYDYHLYFDKYWKKDMDAMILRDRNHPSIIMWSMGNEIPRRDKPDVVNISKMLCDYTKTLDTTRPTTAAINDLSAQMDANFATLDIAGYNYAASGELRKNDIYADDHKRVPERLMYESESYPLEAFDCWEKTINKTYVFGTFVWTAFDYLGEAGIGWRGFPANQKSFPWSISYCGDIDILGNKHPIAYYRDVLWNKNKLSVFVTPPSPSFELNPTRADWSKWQWNDVRADWNHEGSENKSLDVVIYSSCDEVELFLNQQSLGKKPTNLNTKFLANWQVPYTAGQLKAVGYTAKKQVNTSVLQTAAKAQQLKISVDRNKIMADGQDLSYVSINLLDSKGTINPKAQNLVKFEITGPGQIVAVGNANPISLESYQIPQRKAYQGKCMVIIKSTHKAGKIILKAVADDMKPVEITIETSSK